VLPLRRRSLGEGIREAATWVDVEARLGGGLAQVEVLSVDDGLVAEVAAEGG
jgi:hypothetical protein